MKLRLPPWVNRDAIWKVAAGAFGAAIVVGVTLGFAYGPAWLRDHLWSQEAAGWAQFAGTLIAVWLSFRAGAAASRNATLAKRRAALAMLEGALEQLTIMSNMKDRTAKNPFFSPFTQVVLRKQAEHLSKFSAELLEDGALIVQFSDATVLLDLLYARYMEASENIAGSHPAFAATARERWQTTIENILNATCEILALRIQRFRASLYS
jgi:hypothetical protein